MGFVGRKPTNAPLVSSDLGTGIVGSTNIADGTITNTDIASDAAIASSKLSITSPLSITGNSTAGSEIRLPEDTDNGSNYVALKAPNTLSSDLTFTLPSADGSANQALITNGSGSLSFATVGAAAGQVIQVVTSNNTANQTSTSTSYVDATNLSASITPSSTSNKILILFTGTIHNNSDTLNTYITILRSSTNLATTNDYFILNSAGTRIIAGSAAHYVDSPNTTSSTTYKIQIRVESGSTGTVYSNSRITLLEIKG